MPLYKVIEEMKVLDIENIVLVRSGAFFIATDLDACILHEILGLKIIKYGNNMYKIGILVSSLKKYLNKLNEINVPVSVYDTIDNCMDVVCLDNILPNVYIINRKFELKFEKYNYIKIYDNKYNIVDTDNDVNESRFINKNMEELFDIEKERRNIVIAVREIFVKYIKESIVGNINVK